MRGATITSSTILVLDIDGVLNPLARDIDPDGLRSADVGRTPIAWRPSVIGRLNRRIASGRVRPVWCTTWHEAANEVFGPAVGLADLPWPVLDADAGSPDPRRLDWWKVVAISDAVVHHEGTRLIWCDDDLDDAHHAILEGLLPGDVHSCAVESRAGLSPDDLDAIEAWLTPEGP